MARPVRRALDEVRRGVRADGLWRAGDLVLLGCSGGVDSVAAWALLADLRPSLGHRLHIAWVDHGLRDDAAAVEALLVAMAARTAVGWTRLPAAIAAAAADQEALARLARYRALRQLAADLGAAVIATAHHADDVAETVLMRAARGAGIAALGAIPRRNGDVVRPLLGLRRVELVAVAGALGLAWRDDPANFDRRHERVRWRHDVLPTLEAARPGAATGLVRSARHAARAARALEYWLEAAIAPQLTPLAAADDGSAGVGVALPAALVPADVDALGALLQALAARVGAPAPGRRAVLQAHAWLQRGAHQTAVDLRGLRLSHDGNRLALRVSEVASTAGDTYLGHGRPRTQRDGGGATEERAHDGSPSGSEP